MTIASKVFLIALRIAIGWHFLYEGVFKIQSDTGAISYPVGRWASQAATARLHDLMERTPPREEALARIDAWHDEVVKAYGAQKSLAEDQKARLAALRDTVKLAVASGEPWEFDWVYVHHEVVKAAPDPESDRFSSLAYLQGSMFRAMVPDIDGLNRLTIPAVHQRIDSRFHEIVKHYAFTPEQQQKLAAARDSIKTAVAKLMEDPSFQTRLTDYKQMRARHEKVTTAFSRERVDSDLKKLDVIAAEMLALVNEPLSQLAFEAQSLATAAQLGRGPVPEPPAITHRIDFAIEWALVAIGLCLMLGLLTRSAALAAAGILAMFYFASPPWPGMPGATMAGHYMYIDRNLIEMIAALVLATTKVELGRSQSCYSTSKTETPEETTLMTHSN